MKKIPEEKVGFFQSIFNELDNITPPAFMEVVEKLFMVIMVYGAFTGYFFCLTYVGIKLLNLIYKL